ncbi:MAG: hypothetical protein A3E26_02325 [Chlamydiae bacterium RIFCSPHIGHO2_12_FULL_49_32]|nr:MAG: hypothetical protein A3D18_00200 [Chlamydiae bacterium RIFCSPHIGHO2_02_FULL_49_29]OGN63393.1 MAG: hypothetical protein A3E26_02325 [Chlamydiae bacterium RIFCSPHIGHO2_12_FULL_49_32]
MRPRFPKQIGFISLILTNIVVLGGVENWPLIGNAGALSLFFFLLAGLLFFVPSVFVTAELASTWRQAGGLYVWVKEAFGHRAAFTAAWLMWISQIFWFPLPLILINSSTALLFHSPAMTDTFYQLIFSLVLLWVTTFIFFQGMGVQSRLNSIGGMGLLTSGVLITILGFIWIWKEQPLGLLFSVKTFTHDLSHIKNWRTFAAVLTTLQGIEISAFHAQSVKDPKKNYPRAAFISAPISFILAFLGTFAIVAVVAQKQIIASQNEMEVIEIFYHAFNLPGLFPLVLILFILGLYMSINAWYASSIKGLLAIATHGDLPPLFRQVNQQGMPTTLMILQALIISVLSILYILFPQVNYIYWIFVALTIMLYLLSYLFIFSAAIKLRYKKTDVPRPYKIPGGKIGIWLVAGTGLATSLVVSILAFLLPDYVLNFSSLTYFPWFSLGLVLICLAPQFILMFKKASWKSAPSEEMEVQAFLTSPSKEMLTP